MSREEVINHLVLVAKQWNIKTPTGKPYTAEIFGRASDSWLRKQMKRLKAEGKQLAK
jgi:hypothetical protein